MLLMMGKESVAEFFFGHLTRLMTREGCTKYVLIKRVWKISLHYLSSGYAWVNIFVVCTINWFFFVFTY